MPSLRARLLPAPIRERGLPADAPSDPSAARGADGLAVASIIAVFAVGWLGVFGWEVDGYTATIDLPSGAQEILAPTAPGPLVHQPFSGGSVTVARHAARLFAW